VYFAFGDFIFFEQPKKTEAKEKLPLPFFNLARFACLKRTSSNSTSLCWLSLARHPCLSLLSNQLLARKMEGVVCTPRFLVSDKTLKP
jgi:hypothetical protein